jgi:SAM-dependent methyltransferase
MAAGEEVPERTQSEAPARARIPEPMVMDEPDAAAAFDRAGRGSGPLVPVYELCARSISKLLPRDGTVLDLGCGSGRFLAYLAGRRPDARLLGIELSRSMLELGNEMLAAEGLSDRVELIEGDMTAFTELVHEPPQLVNCMLALHQLPGAAELSAALSQVASARERYGCAVWLADIARLEDDRVVKEWIALSPDSDPLFQQDALASEAAGWTPQELTVALQEAGLGDVNHSLSPLLQIHWTGAGDGEGEWAANAELWREVSPSPDLRRRVMALRIGLQGLP